MSAKSIVMAAAGSSAGPTYVDDVFSTSLYDGNGTTQTINNGINLVGNLTAAAVDVKTKFATTLYTGNGTTQTITNGINLAGQGGLVWTKSRNSGALTHALYDTVRGATFALNSAATTAQTTVSDGITGFSSTGYLLGADTGSLNVNASGNNYVSWTFRRAPKFFDVVTYTGDGTAGRQIAHSLGVAPGMIIVKQTNASADWQCIHRNDGVTWQSLQLNLGTSGAPPGPGAWGNGSSFVTPTSSSFTVGGANNVNAATYVAYLFAHDTGTNNLIQCGSYTGNGAGVGPSVSLGWKPQFVLVKPSSSAGGWLMFDDRRGVVTGGNDAVLFAGSNNAEDSNNLIEFSSTGFNPVGTVSNPNASAETYLYMAIRSDVEYDGSSGGLVWLKPRSLANSHILTDTVRGAEYPLIGTNTTAAQSSGNPYNFSFSASGFAIASGSAQINQTGGTYASWTFRKAPKFFDLVTYTGDGVAGRTIAHSLGITPGMIIVKRTDTTGQWPVYHRSLTSAAYHLLLNTTDAEALNNGWWNSTAPTSTVFTVGSNAGVNASGGTYVAYLFAHDTATDGLIQCGSFTTNGSGNATVSLGWEPQFLLYKTTGTGDWATIDSMRGWTTDAGNSRLNLNLSSAESAGVTGPRISATGFTTSAWVASTTYIYIAIRRPNKPPTSGTQVYVSDAYTGTGGATTIGGSLAAPDFILGNRVRLAADYGWTAARLIGDAKYLIPSSSAAEVTTDGYYWSKAQAGVQPTALNRTSSGSSYIAHLMRRAPGFFDVVCYTGTGVARTVAHSLGVVPELMIVKSRSGASEGTVYSSVVGTSGSLYLFSNSGTAAPNMGTGTINWNATAPTSAVFSIGTGSSVNGSGSTYIAYLFATLPGISKVGSYTGNGTSQTVNCGFSTGARFVLTKRTDNLGDWNIGDSARGIVDANDPMLRLNGTAAEVTTVDWLDANSSGFVVNETATGNANTNGATYIYLAIA